MRNKSLKKEITVMHVMI